MQEIGYTDRIIDVRSTRVRALLGLNNNNADQEENHNGGPVNGNESNKRVSETQGRMLFSVFFLLNCFNIFQNVSIDVARNISFFFVLFT